MSSSEKSAGLAVVSDQHEQPASPQDLKAAALRAVILQVATLAGVCKEALQAALDSERPALAYPCLDTLNTIGVLCEIVACHEVGEPFTAALAAEWLTGPLTNEKMTAAGYLA